MRDIDNHENNGLAPNLGKCQEAILFFLYGSGGEQLSKKRLVRLLYLADFDHVERTEQSITGAQYRKREQGPDSDDATRALTALERSGRVVRYEVVVEGIHQHLYEERTHADLSLFSASERGTLNKVLLQWTPASDEQLEDAMQDEAPLIAVSVNDVIPYYLAHYRDTYGAMRLDADELAAMAQAQDEDEVATQ